MKQREEEDVQIEGLEEQLRQRKKEEQRKAKQVQITAAPPVEEPNVLQIHAPSFRCATSRMGAERPASPAPLRHPSLPLWFVPAGVCYHFAGLGSFAEVFLCGLRLLLCEALWGGLQDVALSGFAHGFARDGGGAFECGELISLRGCQARFLYATSPPLSSLGFER